MAKSKIDLTPDTLDLVLYAGDNGDFQIKFQDTDENPVDVSAWEWESQIRNLREATDEIDLTVDNSDGVDGIIIVRIPGMVTANLATSAYGDKSYWDIQATPPGLSDPITMLQGTVTCKKDVSR